MPNAGTRLKPPKQPHRLFVPKVLDEIVASVNDGVWPETAARAQGVAHAIWYEWVRWGRAGHEPYAEFIDRVETGEAVANQWHVRNMRKCASGDNVIVLRDASGNEVGVSKVGDWRPSTWWLSRKFPKQWSEREALRQAAEDAIAKDEMQLPLELLEKYLEKAGYKLVPLDKEAGRETKENGEDDEATSGDGE